MSTRSAAPSVDEHVFNCWLNGLSLGGTYLAIQRVCGQVLSKDAIQRHFADFSDRFAGGNHA